MITHSTSKHFGNTPQGLELLRTSLSPATEMILHFDDESPLGSALH
jgi:hypothetical protein